MCPTWCEVDAADPRVMCLDPGLAFGIGTDETTALCLEWIAAGAAIAGSRVIDFGCGSGVLALAAECCGARSVYAVDIDAQARSAAQSNVELNDMAELIAVLHPDELEPGCACTIASAPCSACDSFNRMNISIGAFPSPMACPWIGRSISSWSWAAMRCVRSASSFPFCEHGNGPSSVDRFWLLSSDRKEAFEGGLAQRPQDTKPRTARLLAS